jgi:predicted aspartyl protease
MIFHATREWLVDHFRPAIGATITGLTFATLACFSASAAGPNDNMPVTQVTAALDAWRMDEVNSLLGSLPNTAGGDYVRGTVSNRTNDIDASTQTLRRALPGLDSSDTEKAIDARFTLSDNYQKTFAYAEQAKMLREAIERYADQIKPDVLASAKTTLALASALSNSPPQTVSFSGESQLPIRRNPLGTLNVDAVANGVSAAWMLDSGANYSIVSQSFAKRLQLTVAGKVPGIGSSTGITVDGEVAIVKEIRLGNATLRNVVVLVVSDEQMHIKLPKGEYQIDGALGYPVFQALGRVSFIGDQSISIGAKSLALTDGTQLYMDGLTPVLILGVEGTPMPFILDTGASSTSLSHTYWMKMAERAAGWQRAQRQSSGLGGAKTFDQVLQPEWKARIGADEVVLKDVEVDTQKKLDADNQPMYGRLGQDLWKNAAGFTIDFRSMRFRLDP